MLNSVQLAKGLIFIGTKSALFSKKFSLSSHLARNKQVAMVLSGSGVYDGSEILETTSAMIHLSKNNADIAFFAPNIEQMHVVNHVTGQIQPETRNVMIESARISRGNMKPLEKLNAAKFDALIIPGGFGAPKNLSDYAINGDKMKLNKEVERVINDFVLAHKPIGFCCIGPVLVANLLPNCHITLGKKQNNKGEWPYSESIDKCLLMGAVVVERDVDEIEVDQQYKVVTTPAFMKCAAYRDVFEGIGKMVTKVLALADER